MGLCEGRRDATKGGSENVRGSGQRNVQYGREDTERLTVGLRASLMAVGASDELWRLRGG